MTFWSSVDRLIDRLGADESCEHGLGPLVARRTRLLGKPLPDRLAREERAAMSSNLVASTLLARARAAYDGPLVLLKGTELSRLYPDRARRFGDLDLLPGDAERAQTALLASGFRLQDRDWPPEGYDDVKKPHYHLHPLEWPGLALRIELHKHVKWPEGLRPPSNDEIFAAAVPAGVGIEGLTTPDPVQHAVILASHAWGEVPMRRLRQLVDVMAFVENRDRAPIRRVARRWGFAPGWQTTLAVADWLFADAPKPLAVRTWARYLEALREPTVVEMHLQEWASPFWMVPPRRAVSLSAAAVARDVRPEIGQTWRDKLTQMLRALRHPLSSKSDHDRRSRRGAWRPGKGPH
jgi:hypothetical protein